MPDQMDVSTLSRRVISPVGSTLIHSVMEWIRVEPTGDITLRESVLTSIWPGITREFGQPPEERRQMTAVVTLTGALSDRLTARRLQARMVKVVSQPGVRRGTTAFRKER